MLAIRIQVMKMKRSPPLSTSKFVLSFWHRIPVSAKVVNGLIEEMCLLCSQGKYCTISSKCSRFWEIVAPGWPINFTKRRVNAWTRPGAETFTPLRTVQPGSEEVPRKFRVLTELQGDGRLSQKVPYSESPNCRRSASPPRASSRVFLAVS